MKGTILALFILLGTTLQAQRFAYIDSQYILEQMPAYREAQNELNELSKRWRETMEAKQEKLKELERAYQAEKILLTDDMKKQREQEIREKREEALKYQRDKFGYEGELFKKRKELIQPLQDDIFNALQEMAKERSYAVVFDKGKNTNILYSDPRYDKSDVLLRKLGLSSGDK